ncbi:MAG: dolichol kinase [Methanocella sp.]
MPFDRQLFFKELGRKAFHMAGCVIPAAYYFFLSKEIMGTVLAACVIGATVLEYMRLTGHDLYPSSYMRPSEGGRLAAYFYAAASMFLAVVLFSKTIAVAAILFLVFGDAITGLAGAVLFMYTGKKSIDARGKAERGLVYAVTHPKPISLMLVMFIVCGVIGLALRPELSYLAIAAGAAGAVIADAFPWRVAGFTIDDNLSIPLLAGALMALASLA